MPLFLITALPGTGKSTVCNELHARGFEAYDGDYDHLAKWYNNSTGKPVADHHERTPEFLQTHSRNIPRHLIEDLAAQAADKPIFLCADPENEDELQDLFAQTFALVADEKTRLYRLATRTNNVWGRLSHERARDAANKPVAEERRRKYGYTIVDADVPVEQAVDQIVKAIKSEVASTDQ